jgi:iron(III) transport system substrate-binding protein
MKKLLVLLMLVALSPLGAQAQTSDGQKSWDETLAAARKEGKVVVSGPPSAELRQAMPAAFKARFGIGMDYLGGRSAETAVRMRAERQAGIHSIDAILAGNDSMALIFYGEKMIVPLKPAPRSGGRFEMEEGQALVQ